MDAPTPRMPDGKPDLSGNWIRFRGEGAFAAPELGGLVRNQAAAAQTPAPPADPNSPPIAAFWEIGANVPGGLPLTPWAAELKKQRMAVERQRQPRRELPADGPDAVPHARPAAQDHAELRRDRDHVRGELRPSLHLHRRTHAAAAGQRAAVLVRVLGRDDGKATRSWSRRTTCGERRRAPPTGGSTCAAARTRSRPSSSSAFAGRHTASWKSTSPLDDPKAYTKPFTVRINQQISPDDEIIEFICNENQQFRRRVKID